jgi:hypothetical protein
MSKKRTASEILYNLVTLATQITIAIMVLKATKPLGVHTAYPSTNVIPMNMNDFARLAIS